jgi:hypothetical protein
MAPEARSVILGHAPGSEGGGYGTWKLLDLATEIQRLLRYAIKE